MSPLSSAAVRTETPTREGLSRSGGTMQRDHSLPLVNLQPLSEFSQVSELCQCAHCLFFSFFLKSSMKVLWLKVEVD